jgi:2'-5' RNA ligase
MKYYLVISPKTLEDSLISESKRLMENIYSKEVKAIYYRVKTKDKLDNPRRLFIKGNGKVLEAEVRPHISLVHNIDLEKVDDFTQKAKAVCKKHRPINLEFTGIGNYGMNFTFFVKFICPPDLKRLRSELLQLSKPFMSAEEYNQHTDVGYIPHATILYDDINPQKVMRAYKMLDEGKFIKPVTIKEIILWEVTAVSQKVIARFPLG